jgi:hypothetical protein
LGGNSCIITPPFSPSAIWETIAALCHDILSIAEVSAKLHVPLGVIRVLVGDMADEHLVMVHRPAHAGDRRDLVLLERVLYGLHTS